jgi:peptide/nickel transport system permease protein
MTADPARRAVRAGTVRPPPARGMAGRVFDSDLWHAFVRSPVTVAAAAVALLFALGALFAPVLAPYDTVGPGTMDVLLYDARTPPLAEGRSGNFYLLGTDNQGRDVLSAILYGTRISLLVGVSSVAFAVVVGVALGLVAGYAGGLAEAAIMRVADVQLSFPAILIALLIDGVARGVLPGERHAGLAIYVLIFAIGISTWVQYARTVRGSTLVETGKEYVQAARVTGIHPVAVMLRHILPNVAGPVMVIATIGLAVAIVTEATLSFLGVGVPPTSPSLGTLIQNGQEVLSAGEWWIAAFPGAALVLLVLSVNLLGDWLRDALNPKLR